MADTQKDKLIRFLERRAWNPVLKAKPKDHDEKRLERVQKKNGEPAGAVSQLSKRG